MFQATVARSLLRKAPQQMPRANAASRSLSTDSFAFYPVQCNRRRVVQTKTTNNDSFAFYPSKGSDRVATKAVKAESSSKSNQLSNVSVNTKSEASVTSKPRVSNWDPVVVRFLKTPQKASAV